MLTLRPLALVVHWAFKGTLGADIFGKVHHAARHKGHSCSAGQRMCAGPNRG